MTIDLKTATAQEIIDAIHADCVPRTAALALSAQLDELLVQVEDMTAEPRPEPRKIDCPACGRSHPVPEPAFAGSLRQLTPEEVVRAIDPNVGLLLDARREIARLTRQLDTLIAAGSRALLTLERISPEDFALGKDRPAREALSAALEEVEMSR